MKKTITNKTESTQKEVSKRFLDIMNDLKGAGKRALKDIPVELLAIDERYQSNERTSTLYRIKQIHTLAMKWDENKLEPIIVVPHIEEGLFYIVNGYGRWQASQMLNPKYEYLTAIVLLGAMDMSADERLIFEAELFAYQNNETSPLKPAQRHDAGVCIGIPHVLELTALQEKYGFAYTSNHGKSYLGALGSYSDVLRIVQRHGFECGDYIFNILKLAGFDRKRYGYSTFVVNALKDMYILYNDKLQNITDYLVNMLRPATPRDLRNASGQKYPLLDIRSACSLYLEDLLVQELGFEQKRQIINNKVVKLPA